MDHRIAGAMVNSAIYLLSVVWFGFMAGHPIGSLLAIAAMGVTYLSYLAQMFAGPMLANVLVWLSLVLGIAAGLSLLF